VAVVRTRSPTRATDLFGSLPNSRRAGCDGAREENDQ
jgi:hypothetical protein